MRNTFLLVCSLFAAVPAFAEPEATAPADTDENVWYGQWVLASDLAAVGLLAAWGWSDSKWRSDVASGVLGGLGVGAYAVGGPLVHSLRGNYKRGVVSGVIRGGLPLLAGYGFFSWCFGQSESSAEDDNCLTGTGVVVLGAMATASIIDVAWLARETKSEPSPGWFPTMNLRSGGATVGVAGAF